MLLVALFATSGLVHLLTPSPFVDIVPRMFPRPELLVALSGAAELLGAAGLLLRRTRRAAGWGLILLLIAVFPSNVKMLLRSGLRRFCMVAGGAMGAAPVAVALDLIAWRVAVKPPPSLT